MIAALRVRLVEAPVTRFAPSPTGHLHLGHVVNAIYVWGLARALGGTVRLRIEDHDRERARPEFERSIIEDLQWLGFVPDLPTRDSSPVDAAPDTRQSDHPQRYTDMFTSLNNAGLTYWCDCSRQRIARDAGAIDAEPQYDGRCRERGLGPGAGRGIRVRLDDGVEAFDDGLLGPTRQNPARQCGDLLIRDRLGNWTYQFAVTVDDLVEGITLVIRGEDLLSSTGRQIRLARLLGRPTSPTFLHHPLIAGVDGRKLSKSSNDTGLRELRAAGVPPEEVIGRAAAEVGLIDLAQMIGAADVARLFL
jgi:glutamyl-Q tRNA(Asp) synthetase